MASADERSNGGRDEGSGCVQLVAERLVAESACELQTDTGEWIEFWLVSADADTVVASAPRLSVRDGMALKWRCCLDGHPLVADLVIEQASYRSERRATLRLRVTAVRRDSKNRRHARRGLAVRATLTAVCCDRIVDGDWIAVTVTDISDSGIGLVSTDGRARPGDRFRIDLHMVGIRLETDVRVTRMSRQMDGRTSMGCELIGGSLAAAEQVKRILARVEAGERNAA
jgi:hypothetical protein